MSKKDKKIVTKVKLPRESFQLLEAAAALQGVSVESYMRNAVVSTVLSDLELLESCLDNLAELEKLSRKHEDVEILEEVALEEEPEQIESAPAKKAVRKPKAKKAAKKGRPAKKAAKAKPAEEKAPEEAPAAEENKS